MPPPCPFYAKRCSLLAPCCGKFVCCHRCHDKAEAHRLPRQMLQLLQCNSCLHHQRLSEGDTCLRCGAVLAAYFCRDCGIANDNVPAGGYFHCDACGICRVGSRDDYFHCNGCNCCLQRRYQGDHVCMRDALDGPCPICLQGPMFDSQAAAHMLPCGHFAHLRCINSNPPAADRGCSACRGLASSSSVGSRPAQQQPGGSSSSSLAAAAAAAAATEPTLRVAAAAAARLAAAALQAAVDTSMTCWLSGSFGPSEAGDLESVLQELKDAQLLPHRQVTFTLEAAPRQSGGITMTGSPKQVRQQLEAEILRSVLLSEAEDQATGRAVDAVAQLLVRAGSRGVLRLPFQYAMGLPGPFTVDRVVVAGSVGKSVSVQGDFDVDLVAFLNLPAASFVVVDLCNPDDTQNSSLFRLIVEDVLQYLQQQLPCCSGLRCISPPRLGRTAIKFTLGVTVPESGTEIELSLDVVLAPSMSTGAGAEAAAAWGVYASRDGTAAEVQRKAVLAPVLALAADVARIGEASRATAGVAPSFARNIWLTEAATEFTQQAAVAAAQRGGISGRVVTNTIRVMKAWVRKGLHGSEPGDVDMQWLRSFQIELFVLHAAERLARRPHPVFGGRYVLDLLLETLRVVVEWADRACAGSGSSDLVLFTELVQGRYYSRQQAQALQQLPLVRAKFGVQPAVVHPVDPLKNVFGEGDRSIAWETLGHEAHLLLAQLQQCSWEHIMHATTLGEALRMSSPSWDRDPEDY